MTPTNESDRHLSAICAARLHGQLQAGWLSIVLDAAGLIVLAQGAANVAWLFVLLAGIAERYVAVRLAIDERLFVHLAAGGLGLATMDAGLTSLGIPARTREERPLSDRVAGALRWARRHTGIVIVQVLGATFAIGGF